MSGHLLESKMNLDEYQMHQTKGQQKKKPTAKWMLNVSRRHEKRSDLRLYTLRFARMAMQRVNEWRRGSIPKLNNE